MGLAGIGGAEHGFDTSGAQRRGKLGQGHGRSNLHFMDASTDRSGGECSKTGQKNGAALTLRTGAERTMSESLTSGRMRWNFVIFGPIYSCFYRVCANFMTVLLIFHGGTSREHG
jgi:hypothetical protein